MNRKELTKTFIMISTWKKPSGLQGFQKIFGVVRVKALVKATGVN